MTNSIKRREGIILRRIQDELVLLDLESKKIHQLNESASFIWDAWDHVLDERELAKLLAERFQVDEYVALNDLCVIADRLHALNLVVKSGTEA